MVNKLFDNNVWSQIPGGMFASKMGTALWWKLRWWFGLVQYKFQGWHKNQSKDRENGKGIIKRVRKSTGNLYKKNSFKNMSAKKIDHNTFPPVSQVGVTKFRFLSRFKSFKRRSNAYKRLCDSLHPIYLEVYFSVDKSEYSLLLVT